MDVKPQHRQPNYHSAKVGAAAQTGSVGPGEIKRSEVSWTLTKKLDTFAGPGEIKRRERVALDPQVSPPTEKRSRVAWRWSRWQGRGL